MIGVLMMQLCGKTNNKKFWYRNGLCWEEGEVVVQIAKLLTNVIALAFIFWMSVWYEEHHIPDVEAGINPDMLRVKQFWGRID